LGNCNKIENIKVETSQFKKVCKGNVGYVHWRRLGASFFGGWGRHVSAKIIFAVPQNAKFGADSGGDSLSLGTKC